MIIVKLIGGLGNQLFQYALGRHTAETNQSVLKIDISGFEEYTLHKYSLWAFNIQENIASVEEVKALTVRSQGTVQSVIRQLLGRPPVLAPTYIREKRRFHFDPEILNVSDGVYLDGSWQNERYFIDISGIIRQEFTVKTPPSGKNKELIEQISGCNSVSLHIRREDFVSDAHTTRVHGICELDYYFRCVEYINQKIKEPHFFVFSDNPEWARANLNLPHPMRFFDHNGPDKNYEDLRLMSQCKHHIIANSTFSWWGAWLNQNREKIVLAPKQWLESDDYDPKDLIPDKWIKV